MTQRWLAVLCAIAFIAGESTTAQTGKSIRVSIEPEITYALGETQYDMVIIDNPGGTGAIGGRSLLEFPLNCIQAGGTVRLRYVPAKGRPFGLALTAATKLNDPFGKMKDGDWVLLGSGQSFKFSYTESDPKLSLFRLNVEGSIGFPSSRRMNFDLIAGFRYQRFVQKIDNFKGWQYDNVGEIHYLDEYIYALYYRVTYASPFLGFRMNFGHGTEPSLSVQAAAAPTSMKDYDNHLLRMKDATASGWGEGLFAETNLRLPLYRQRAYGPSLDFRLKFTYIHGNLSQTQRWYGDDPASEEDDTGKTLSGIPHEMKLTDIALSARLRLGL